MWIVMTSSAHMPNSCRGRYRNVALVKLNQHYTAHGIRPAMISGRARGVLQISDMGHHSVGKTERCGYNRALAEANRRAFELNNTPTVEAGDALLMSWGGSA
jgi:hypothetical protein